MRRSLFALLLVSANAFALPPLGGEALAPSRFADDVPVVRRGVIQRRLDDTTFALRHAGVLAPANVTAVSLQWPLLPLSDYPYPGYYGISNFVDHDASFPGHISDYTCGTRSYNTAQGYNHSGTDYFLWPAPWRTMDAQQVAIVAAAPGTIIGRSEGNFDRSCAMGNDEWNAVYVRHADGSVAWYGHMKRGSVTPKQIGDTVDTGEVLGFVGSSGSSTGPHLHFELHDAGGRVIDPRHGQCSAGPDYWAQTQAYEEPRINSLSITDAQPEMVDCGVSNGLPVHETLHETDTIAPGQRFYVLLTFRDLSVDQPAVVVIRRPDDSVFKQWQFDLRESGLGGAYYPAVYWFWDFVLAAGDGNGAWSVAATYQGQTTTTEFFVGDATMVRRIRVQRERAATAILSARPRP